MKMTSRLGHGTYGIVSYDHKNKLAVKSIDRESFEIGVKEVSILSYMRNSDTIINVKNVQCDQLNIKIHMERLYKFPKKTHMKKALDITRQILLAVYNLHKNGIMHLDIKPDNILVDEIGDKITLIDFGLSSFMTIFNKNTDFIVQSPNYRAPEVAIGGFDVKSAYDHRADIFSIGVILINLLTGRNYDEMNSHSEKKSFAPKELREKYIKVDQLKHLKIVIQHYKNYFSLKDIVDEIMEKDKNTEMKKEVLLDFLSGLLSPDPSQRLSAGQALEHKIFNDKMDYPFSEEIVYENMKKYNNRYVRGKTPELKIRHIVFDWILEVIEEFKFPSRIYFDFVRIFDCVFSKITDINKNDIQGYAIASLFIADCVSDIFAITIDHCIAVCDYIYTECKMMDIISCIVEKCHESIIAPSEYRILEMYHKLHSDIDFKTKLKFLYRYTLTEDMVKNSPGELVECALNNTDVSLTLDPDLKFVNKYMN